MKYIDGKVLFIFDPHQDVQFINAALKHIDEVDYVVFGGDYFDTSKTPDQEKIYGMATMCTYLNGLYKELGDKAIWLVGNHDLSYLAAYSPKRYAVNMQGSFHFCAGFTKNKARIFNNYITKEFRQSLELCVSVNGYIVSHAGFHPSFFKNPYATAIENIETLYDDWEYHRDVIAYYLTHWISHIGSARIRGFDGNVKTRGSPVWLDWYEEFEPIEGIKQIVGHTTDPTGHSPIMDNHNFDWHQTMYAIMDKDGNITKYDVATGREIQ